MSKAQTLKDWVESSKHLGGQHSQRTHGRRGGAASDGSNPSDYGSVKTRPKDSDHSYGENTFDTAHGVQVVMRNPKTDPKYGETQRYAMAVRSKYNALRSVDSAATKMMQRANANKSKIVKWRNTLMGKIDRETDMDKIFSSFEGIENSPGKLAEYYGVK